MAALLPLADLFMAALLSRPPGGTLRTTWVTPATLQMSGAVAVAGSLLGAVAAVSGFTGGRWVVTAAGILLILLAIGSASVAAVGLAQRRIGRH